MRTTVFTEMPLEKLGSSSPAVPALYFAGLMTSWWDEINESTRWQNGIYFALCGAYALVSSVALVIS